MKFLENSLLNGLIGTKLPIIQAPMAGGAATPEMAAAVSESGGLGSLALGYSSADEIRSEIRAVRGLTDRSFGVNLFFLDTVVTDPELASEAIQVLEPFHRGLGLQLPELPNSLAHSFDDQISVVLDERVPVFSFTFGIPNPEVLTALRRAGTVVLGTATTVEEGRLLADSGVDAVVAQGAEAGGIGELFSATSMTRCWVWSPSFPKWSMRFPFLSWRPAVSWMRAALSAPLRWVRPGCRWEQHF